MPAPILNFARDAQGFNTFAPQFAPIKFSATLSSSGHATVTVPSTNENWIVSFSIQPGSDIWVALNATASPPAGATFASTTSELLPGSRSVKAGDVLDIYNNGTSSSDVGVLLYAIP